MGHSIAVQLTSSDAELLEASRRGERGAFGELVGRYQRVVSAVSYSRTGNRELGEDVAQETFIAAWRQLDQLREPNRLRSWLCGIARNLARKASRKSVREVADDTIDVVARDNPFDNVSSAQAERVVGDALSRVPETYRDVLVLYYQEQLSVREVSETLGISEAAALQRLSRGRQYLANGVNALVEKSLRKPPRRDLVAGTLAAISVIEPSRASAMTASHGGKTMFKLIAAAAVIAAGTTTAVVIHNTDSAPQITTEVATARTEAAPTIIKRGSALPHAVAHAPALADPSKDPNLPPGAILVAPPDTDPSIDARTIKRLRLDRGPARGPVAAPVTIVMFTDLQCPYCGKSHGVLDQLFDEYPNKLRLIIKQMPVHKTAELGAEAALAADAQGKFWELDNLMIANHEDLSKDAIVAMARQVPGLDAARLERDLENHTYAGQLADEERVAKELEVQGTPTFIINGRKVTGALPIEEIRKTIEASMTDK